jgi:hypothetical protein
VQKDADQVSRPSSGPLKQSPGWRSSSMETYSRLNLKMFKSGDWTAGCLTQGSKQTRLWMQKEGADTETGKPPATLHTVPAQNRLPGPELPYYEARHRMTSLDGRYDRSAPTRKCIFRKQRERREFSRYLSVQSMIVDATSSVPYFKIRIHQLHPVRFLIPRLAGARDYFSHYLASAGNINCYSAPQKFSYPFHFQGCLNCCHLTPCFFKAPLAHYHTCRSICIILSSTLLCLYGHFRIPAWLFHSYIVQTLGLRYLQCGSFV